MREECKDCNRSLEDCTCIEDTIEFTEADIEIFIDGIENPAEPNQALKDAAERLKGKELFKESNDRARKILSEIKSLPIQETLEEVAEKYVNSFEFGIAHPRRVCKNAFINGAKWQQEQYTIEEQHVGHTIDELDKEYIKGFNEGSAYYIERMYSEEEVIAFGEFIFKHSLLTHTIGVKSLFEQFKKK